MGLSGEGFSYDPWLEAPVLGNQELGQKKNQSFGLRGVPPKKAGRLLWGGGDEGKGEGLADESHTNRKGKIYIHPRG